MFEKIKDRIISPQASMLDAMKLMGESMVKMLFVFTDNRFEGIVTIGFGNNVVKTNTGDVEVITF